MASSDDCDSGRCSPSTGPDGYEFVDSINTINDIKEADRIMHILQDTYDPQLLKKSLLRLQRLFKNVMVKKFLEDNQIHLGVLDVMKHLSSFPDIQQIGLQLLCQFIDESLALEKSLKNEHVHRHVLKVLSENISDIPIHQCGMKLLACLFESRYIRVDLTSTNLLNDVIDYLFRAISNFQEDVEIQVHALTCLRHILQEERLCNILEEDLIHEKIMPYVKIDIGNEDILEASLKLLHLMFNDAKVVASAVKMGFIKDSLVPVMLGKPANETIQVAGLHMFRMAAVALFEDHGTMDMAFQWLKVIYMGMSKLMDCPAVQEAGCLALCELLAWKSEAYMWIGESSELKQDPLHTLCLGAVLMGRRELTVFTAACSAFYHLTADNDGLCKCLMEKNAHIAVLEGIAVHITDPSAMAAACRALRGLSIFHDEHKQAISEQDKTLVYLTKILRTFQNDANVQSEAISTVACLADVDVFRHLCFLKKIHKRILVAMEMFPANEILQEACIEALAVLGGAASGADILNSLEVVQKVIRCLKKYSKNDNIQKKALILVQILADTKLVSSLVMCETLADAISSVMAGHPDNISIQREAVVAMQILAEKSQRMSEVLVTRDCHEVLFRILENFDADQGLHDLASECLYVIGCVQNFKSRMLLCACKNGFLAGVECLMVIGADVNTGQGQGTPLYHSVDNGDEKMVRYLLQQSVTDVQTSLNLSITRHQHNITGMLLAHIGQDKDAGTVLWNGYGLGDLRPEWFLPSLARAKERSLPSGAGKHLVEKLRRSEQRRQKRLRYSPSDSQLEINRHHYFRYRRNSGDASKDTPTKSAEWEEDLHPIKTKRPLSLPKNLFRNGSAKRGSTPWKKPGQSTCSDQTSPTKSSPPKSLPTTKPPSQMPDQYKSLPPGLGNDAILASTPGNGELLDTPVFEHSVDELEEWKQTTLTGANIPFSPSDPRRNSLDKVGNTLDEPRGKWLRKYSPVKREHRDDHFRKGTRSLTDSFTDSGQSFSSEVSNRSPFSESEMETSTEILPALQTHPSFKRDFHMTCLDVSQNNIESLSHLLTADAQLLACFARLEKLDLSHNQLEKLPDKLFKNFPRLQYVDIRYNKLKSFPHEVIECTALISLDLSHNQITQLSNKDLSGIYSIRELNLSSNQIENFPDKIDRAMPNLEKLILYNNKISSLPKSTMNLPELRRLDLSRNVITIMHDKFLSACHKLETLEMVSNGLEQLPGEDMAKNFPRLSTLKLKGNQLKEKEPFYIPKFILELQSLRFVDLSKNGLLGFPPPVLWKSQILKEILVSENSIARLHLDGAKAWAKVEKFHIARNKLSEMPKDIGHLVSLQSLDMNHNKALTSLPDELGRCSRMWEMPLDGLNLSDLDDSLVKGRVKDLIIYLHNRLKKAQRYFRMKLMVVGFGNRGKTTLLHTLRKKTKHRNETRPTVGVVVDDWRYERQNFRHTMKYTLSTWDFAGQEEFYSTHQCFLSNRALYLVVYDVSKGPEEIDGLKPWLSNIHFRAPGCPVIVVGTHFDKLDPEHAADQIDEMEAKLYELSKKPGFPELNCTAVVDATKENLEVERLRRRVKEVIDSYKVRGQLVMGQKVPASYVRLAELLSEEARTLESIRYPVIRQGRLVQIVRNEGLDLYEEEELQQAVRFLHEGGVLLHYNETALQLRDFYFINPGWLCRMMAQVVTVRNINPFIDATGIMKKSDVNLLFRGESFPNSLIPQYLRLLEKFEIALPRNEEELLVPCRLPEQKPALKMPNLAKHEKISRIYSMPYTPLGFWSRLITRLIVFSNSNVTETMMQLTRQPQLQYWRQGILVRWSNTAFFLVDATCQQECEELYITVPASQHGYQLMGFMADHIDALIDEWYPGLTSIDPILGRELLEKFVPCVKCKGTEPYKFLFEDLLRQSERSDVIKCPYHEDIVQLADLAPDVMLRDLEDKFHMDCEQFELKESSEYLLGDGGFGAVYRAIYKNQVVAAKVFAAIGDVHPHKMLRQEATILRRLNHPSVVSLISVGLRPSRVVVLELAALGSLGSLLKSNTPLSRCLQHRIAVQVAEGLQYLHLLMVVYRDLKPDNVLVFSNSPSALVNAKISDYGISQFTTLYGLTAQEGTPAYRAPEVVRRETYSFQADVFSFGITLYCLLTGRHPYDELEFKSEMDKAVAENRPVPAITQRGQSPWPDMQDVIMQCLQQIPDHRPSSSELVERLSSAELFCLKDVIPVSVGTTVECMAHQVLGEDNVRLWVASGDSDYMQLSWLNLVNYQDDSRGKLNRKSLDYSGRVMREGRILCILPIDEDHVLLGTQTGKIWVFNARDCDLKHSTRRLPDSVLSLHLIHRGEDNLVLAGLANGGIKFCPVSEIIEEPDTTLLGMNLGKSHEPVRCLVQVDKRIIASCGTKIVIFISSRNGLGIEKDFDTVKTSGKVRSPICTMAVGRNIYLSRRRSEVLEVWDHNKERQKGSCSIAETFRIPTDEARITSILYLRDSRALWVGTGGGHVVVVDAVSQAPIMQTARHTASIRSLMAIKAPAFLPFCVVLSGGLGFRHRPEAEVKKDGQYGCIAVWDAEFPQIVRQFEEDRKKRQELENNMKKQRRKESM
ncbi:leucine-rich repeat serine/threonine-protein kinase 2-like [Haliotis cracherodii]|uniref:leucine-rich repeat serine/threonine-protein kinase 2-like n=1 Tax=Haliotis cracherodii TaxID=6455 RepID=UPI0039E8E455